MTPKTLVFRSHSKTRNRTRVEPEQVEVEWLNPNDREKLREWDQFILESSRGHHHVLSTRLRMYLSFGFRFEVLVVRAAGQIVGGGALIHFGGRLFRICTSPVCPVVDIGQEQYAASIVDMLVKRAKSSGAFLLQMHFPCSADGNSSALLPIEWLPDLPEAKPGLAFTFGRGYAEMLWLEFPQNVNNGEWREHMLGRFGKYHRKKIRLAERDGLEVFEASTEEELREAYSVIKNNSRLQGYTLRSWRAVKQTLIEQVASGQAVMLIARHHGESVGAHYGVLAGRRYTYALGGTLRKHRNINAGHFLQWVAMKRARELGMAGLDLTNRTNSRINQFKMGFHPECISLIEPRYMVFSEPRFFLFRRLYPVVRKSLPQLLRALNFLTGVFNRSAQPIALLLVCVNVLFSLGFDFGGMLPIVENPV